MLPAPMRRPLVLLLLWCAALFLPGLGTRDLWNPNEVIYGRAVVEMRQAGTWLVPLVNGQDFAEKPILYYWMGRVSAALFGTGEAALRLPLVLFGALGVFLLYGLVRRHTNERRALLAGLVLASSYMYLWCARSIQMDLLVTVTSLGCAGFAFSALEGRLPPLRGWLLSGLFAGLGFLAKGPVGIVCPGIAVLLFLVVTRRLRDLRPLHLLAALLVATAVAAPYYVALAMTGHEDVLYEMLVRQNFSRFKDAWDHVKPWHYYLPYVFLDFAPWSLLLPFAVLPRKEKREPLEVLAWCWLAGIVVFFSLSQSKRSPYILPVAPAIAILVAAVLERAWDGLKTEARALRGLATLIGLALLGGAVALLVPSIASGVPVELQTTAQIGLVVFAILGAMVIGTALRGPRPALFGLLATLCGLVVFAGVEALPRADRLKSAKPFCELTSAALTKAPGSLVSYGLWEWRSSYIYYLDRNIPNLRTVADLERLWKGPDRTYVLVEKDRLEEIRPLLETGMKVAERPVGGNVALLYSNR